MPYRILQRLQFLVVAALMTVGDRLAAPARPGTDEDDRGDVPGWVMITVMTAIVVIALLTVYRTQVTTAVENAFNSVSGAGKG